MDNSELLEKVKQSMLISDDFHDEMLKNYIVEVKGYLISAGVRKSIVNSVKAVGVISRGVMDLWNFGLGQANFSEYFTQRAIQLSLKGGDGDSAN